MPFWTKETVYQEANWSFMYDNILFGGTSAAEVEDCTVTDYEPRNHVQGDLND